MEDYAQNMSEISNRDSLKKTPVDKDIIPKDGKGNVEDESQMEFVFSKGTLAKETLLEGKFVRGEVEDLLTISHDEEVVWEEEGSIADWILVAKNSKERKKGGKREDELASTKNIKKGPKAKGEILNNRSGGLSSTPLGATLKNGDVGSSPSSVGRPSNLQKKE